MSISAIICSNQFYSAHIIIIGNKYSKRLEIYIRILVAVTEAK